MAFQIGDLVSVAGGPKSRWGGNPNGDVAAIAEDGIYTVNLWGMVGPGDSWPCHGVPESAMTLIHREEPPK